jgi:hypothetical protein
MKRALIALVTALPLAVGAAVAQADSPGHWGHDQGTQSSASVVAVAGTITSVDSSTSTFTANAYVPTGEAGDQGDTNQSGDDDQGDTSQSSDSGESSDSSQSSDSQNNGDQSAQGNFHNDWQGSQSGPSASTTPVTITTDGATTFRVDGQDGTISNLSPGQRFVALFTGSPGDSLQTLVSSPALAVYAHSPEEQRQLYAFVGTVSGVNAGAGTVTVQVTNSLPAGLVPASSNPATFTVSSSTMVLGGSATNGLLGGSVSDVAVGDVVAGGLVGPAGETLSQVESSPLQVLIDFPASATPATTSSMRRLERQRALTQALALFGYKGAKKSTAKRHQAHHHAKTHAKTLHGTSRSRTHARRT